MEMEKVTTMEDATVGEVVEAEEVSLPGFRFHPTDDELIGFYLRRKVEKRPISIDIIKQIDIYKFSNVGDKEWYFLCQRGRKYRNSIRPNRVTGSGFWKATGIDRPVYASGGGTDFIGLKKSLVYYRGSAGKGTKTDWMMHEFRLPSGGAAVCRNGNISDGCIQQAETWTICRIFKRSVPYKKHAQCLRGIQSRQVPSEPNSITSSTVVKNSVATYLEEKHQLYEDQWNPSAQASSAASYPNFPSSNSAEFGFGEGNWDELGTIVEFSVDPSNVYECRYSYP